MRRAALLLAAVLVAGCTGASTRHASLADVRAFVRTHPTSTYAGRIEHRVDGEGDRIDIQGELGRHGAWRESSSEPGGSVTEVLQVGGHGWVRDAERGRDLADAPWIEGHFGAAMGYDDDLLRLLGDVQGARRLGASRLRGTLRSPRSERITLSVGPGGRLDRLVIRDVGARYTWVVDLRFRRWGSAIELTPPPAADVEATPAVDEAGLAAFPGGGVLVPTDLPDGWELASATVVSHEDGVCAEAWVDYVDALGEPAAEVRAIEAPCPFDHAPRTGRPKRFGRYQGVLVYKDTELWWDPDAWPAARVDLPGVSTYVLAGGDVSLLERLVPSLAPFRAPQPTAVATT